MNSRINRKKTIITKKQGVMTVEAAMVLPLFIIAMIIIGYILNMYYVHRIVGTELDNTCRAIAAYAYPAQIIKQEISEYGSGDETDDETGEKSYWTEIINLGSSAAISARISTNVNKDPIAASLISGGISCLRSRILTDGSTVDLVAEYSIRLPVSFLKTPTMRFLQRSRMQAWVGYELPDPDDDSDENEVYVFITENGKVYHLSENCTYLKPSVRAVSGGAVKNLRNSSGGKYYPCEICNASKNPKGTVYITGYGTRYHTSSSCSAIEHNYRRVPLSEVEGVMPACSKCGNSH